MVMRASSCVLVGISRHIERLLPWFWHHLRLHSGIDVVFADFGMTEKGLLWCKKRGEILTLPLEEPERKISKIQRLWFKKPLACSCSSYEKTLWLDIDCEVRFDVSEIFSLCENPYGIALAKDPAGCMKKTVYDEEEYKMHLAKGVNSGVIPFLKDTPIISLWIDELKQNSLLYRGDQDALSYVVSRLDTPIDKMPQEMNWLGSMGSNPNALIYHWHGLEGKSHIVKELELLQHLGIIEDELGD